MKYTIQVNNISKNFRHRGNTNVLTGLFKPKWQYNQAVNNVSFTIGEAEAVAFLGPNGAGKTTTTKMLTGLVKPSSGEIIVLGHEPFLKKPDFLKNIGLVMGNKAGLNWDLTATQSFELLQKIYEIPSIKYKKRLDDMARMLQVEHVLNRQVRKLSLGERMKLELIGSLLHDPTVVFLDEPTIGLDIASKNSVRSFLRTLHKNGKTILLTSHDMDDISNVCERVIVIAQGTLLFDGSMASLNKQYSDKRYIKLDFSSHIPSLETIKQYGDIISSKKNSFVIATSIDSTMHAITNIGAQHTIKDITVEAVPLEVVINDLYKKIEPLAVVKTDRAKR